MIAWLTRFNFSPRTSRLRVTVLNLLELLPERRELRAQVGDFL